MPPGTDARRCSDCIPVTESRTMKPPLKFSTVTMLSRHKEAYFHQSTRQLARKSNKKRGAKRKTGCRKLRGNMNLPPLLSVSVRKKQRKPDLDDMEESAGEDMDLEEKSDKDSSDEDEDDSFQEEEDDEEDEEEEEREAEGDEEDEEDEEVLTPYDHKSEDCFIENGDPIIVGWASSNTWSVAVAQEDYESEQEVNIRVHHHSFEAQSKSFLPSWVTEKELKKYLGGTGNNRPPKELLARNQPRGHVAYITPIEINSILLAGPVAELEGGFLTELQHTSVRYFLSYTATQICFGSKKSKKKPICPICSSAE